MQPYQYSGRRIRGLSYCETATFRDSDAWSPCREGCDRRAKIGISRVDSFEISIYALSLYAPCQVLSFFFV